MSPAGPESPSESWLPPEGAQRARRADPAEAWRTKLSDRELTIATVVGVIAALFVPFVGLLVAILLLVDRHIPHGIGVMLLALLASPLFPIWS